MLLSDSARRLLALLPFYYAGEDDDIDPIVGRVLEAKAAELDRLRSTLLAIRSTTIPSQADDTVGMLARWEGALGLPIRPADATVEQRRAKVTAALRSRRVVSGADWTASLSNAIGSDAWTASENTPGDYQLTIEIPYVPGGYNAGQVEELARRRTPANLQIIMRYEAGFIVGVSRVGDAI